MESQQKLKSLINLMLNIGYRRSYIAEMVIEYQKKYESQNLNLQIEFMKD